MRDNMVRPLIVARVLSRFKVECVVGAPLRAGMADQTAGTPGGFAASGRLDAAVL